MPKRARHLAAAAVFALWLSCAGGTARAQEIQITGPLAGAGPAVRRGPILAFEVGPTVSFPVASDLHATPLAGARLGYRGSGRWLVGVWGAHAVEPPPVAHGSDERIGQLAWIASPEVGLSPLTGRIGTFVDTPVHGVLSLLLAPALVGLRERADCAAGCDRTLLVSHAERTVLAGTSAVQIALHPGDVASLAFDWRVLLLERSRGLDLAGAGARGDSPDGRIDAHDRELAVDQLFTVRLSVFFPDPPSLH